MYENQNIKNRFKRDLGLCLILLAIYLIASVISFAFTGHWL